MNKPIIRLEDISKSFFGVPVLKNVDFEAHSGEVPICNHGKIGGRKKYADENIDRSLWEGRRQNISGGWRGGIPQLQGCVSARNCHDFSGDEQRSDPDCDGKHFSE